MANKAEILATIERIAAAERVTRKELGNLSRTLLVYIPETADVDTLNRLLEVLTPMNRRGFIEYAKHFLDHVVEKTPDGSFIRFGKKEKGANKLAKRAEARKEFLSEPRNTFWVWSNDNLEIKVPDYFARVENAVKGALKGNEEKGFDPITPAQAVKAVLAGGVTLHDMLAALDDMVKLKEQHEAQAAEEQRQAIIPALAAEMRKAA